MTETLIFKTDQAATYICRKDDANVFGENMWSFAGNFVTYSSPQNDLRYTGKVRNQGRMGGVFPYSVGNGRRAVMMLDTGEGVEKITGVVLTANRY